MVFEAEGKVCKLNKALYGLREAPRAWNRTFNEFMLSQGFSKSRSDNCVYLLKRENMFIIVLVYVDDILILENNLKLFSIFKTNLLSKFKSTDLGKVKNFLGLEINFSEENCSVEISQRQLINKIVKKFRLENCHTYETPMEKGLKLVPNDDPKLVTRKPYKELLGCLIYIMIGSRPDIAYALGYLSRFQSAPTENHYTYLLRVAMYLKCTIGYRQCFRNNADSAPITGYSDASFAESHDQKSTSGSIVMVYGNPIAWISQKQKLVSLSSTEAEYIALCETSKLVLSIRNLLMDLNIEIEKLTPITIFEDNIACIKLANNFNNNKRVKHIDVKYHFICDIVEQKLINLKFVESKFQLADLLTKSLGKIEFRKFVEILKLR